ncbi:MAG: phosphoadenylyl-sulfate reductase [Armatimonadota bacterium]
MVSLYIAEAIDNIDQQHTKYSAAERIAWAVKEAGRDLTFAGSFGAEDMVVLDLLLAADPQASVFLLDTGRLHQETYDVIEAARQRYGRNFTVYAPDTAALETLLREQGPNSFYQSVEARKACCRIRKVKPLARALSGKKGWITGLRREQAVTRAYLPFVEIDIVHARMLKFNPLADWSEEQVWTYISEHELPYNALHDRGFPSIGCAPCTRAVEPDEDLRAGRWWWEQPEHKECGLHLK